MKLLVLALSAFLYLSSCIPGNNEDLSNLKAEIDSLKSRMDSLEQRSQENQMLTRAKTQPKTRKSKKANETHSLHGTEPATADVSLPAYSAPAKSTYVVQTSGRCQAITKKGTQCKRSARSGGYCWQHGG